MCACIYYQDKPYLLEIEEDYKELTKGTIFSSKVIMWPLHQSNTLYLDA